MIRIARPAHPGQFIRMEVLDPLGLNVTEAAKVLGVTRAALSALLNGRASLSPEMALRVEKAFMQASYDIAGARNREREIKVKRDVVRSCRAPAALSRA